MDPPIHIIQLQVKKGTKNVMMRMILDPEISGMRGKARKDKEITTNKLTKKLIMVNILGTATSTSI